MEYIKDLIRFIPIASYGGCLNTHKVNVDKRIEQGKYFFNFNFENTIDVKIKLFLFNKIKLGWLDN
jgi:hypothetical protein